MCKLQKWVDVVLIFAINHLYYALTGQDNAYGHIKTVWMWWYLK